MSATRPVPLAPLTSLGVGGAAERLLEASEPDQLVGIVRRRLETTGPTPELLVLGGATNVVLSDEGFAGTVLHVTGGEVSWLDHGDGHWTASVDAGVDWDRFVAESVRRGLTGVEMMSGVPGSVGAAPVQNIGAYGQQVADVIDRVEVVDRLDGAADTLAGSDCGFAFRHSNFKDGWLDRFLVTRVHVRLADATRHPPAPSTYVDIVRSFERTGAAPTDVASRRRAVLETRRAKSMLIDPDDPDARSVGSFFINPTVPTALAVELATRFETLGLPVHYLEGHGSVPPEHTRIPAAHLLRASGFHAGDSWGPVAMSTKHVLALTTRPGASATDVWNVGHAIRRRVLDETGVALSFEPTFVGGFPDYDHDRVARTYHYVPAPDVEPDWLAGYRTT